MKIEATVFELSFGVAIMRLKAGRTFMALAVLGLTACSGANDVGEEAAWRPTFSDTPMVEIAASSDPEVIARGAYLVNAVAHCTSCHMPRGSLAGLASDQVFAALPSGGREWSMGPDVTIRSPNITPHPTAGIGGWTDAQLARAIKHAVDREGRSLFLMNGLGYIADEDVSAIVSYLRSMRPVNTVQPRTAVTSAGQDMIRAELPGYLLPRPQHPVPYVPVGETSVARGNYLVNGPARCIHCHSDVQAAPTVYLRGPLLAGSQWPEPDPDNADMEMNAPNLTPSASFGVIVNWSEDNFVQRFRAGRILSGSEMPWENFQQLTDADLRSIYRYLMSVPPAEINPGPSYREQGWTAPVDTPNP